MKRCIKMEVSYQVTGHAYVIIDDEDIEDEIVSDLFKGGKFAGYLPEEITDDIINEGEFEESQEQEDIEYEYAQEVKMKESESGIRYIYKDGEVKRG